MSDSLTLYYSDAFAGGLVAGIVEGKPLEQSIDMGHWLASLSIKELGPQYVSPVKFDYVLHQIIPNHQAPACRHFSFLALSHCLVFEIAICLY